MKLFSFYEKFIKNHHQKRSFLFDHWHLEKTAPNFEVDKPDLSTEKPKS